MTDLVSSLASAWREGRTLAAAPWQDSVADAAQAYGAQDQLAQAMGWFGTAVPGHWKSGGPSRDAMLTHAPCRRQACAPAPQTMATCTSTVPASNPRLPCAWERP